MDWGEVMALVRGHFDEDVVEGGLELRAGVHLRRAEWPVVAQVSDDGLHIATVHYRPEAQHLHGECSCERGGGCPHVVAAAIEAFEAQGVGSAEAAELIADQRAVAGWVAALGMQTHAQAEQVPSRHFLLYLLSPSYGRVIDLQVLTARLAQRGSGFVGKRVLRLERDLVPTWVTTADRQRIAQLRLGARGGDSVSLSDVDAELIRDLATSGQLYWSEPDRPLSWGKPRVGSPRWVADGERYRVEFGTPHMVVARDCYFVDPVLGLFGPFDPGTPAALVAELLVAPPVPPVMLPVVQRSLAELLGPEHPLAQVAENVEALPTPRFAVRIYVDEHALWTRASLAYDAAVYYGERRFELAEWDPLRPLARDLLAENAALEELEGHWARARPDRMLSAERGLRAESEYVLQRVVPELRARGWTCEIDDDVPAEVPLEIDEVVETLAPRTGENHWFSFGLGVSVGGQTVKLLPLLLEAIRRGELLIHRESWDDDPPPGLNFKLPDGRLFFVPGERLARWVRPLIELQLRGLSKEGEIAVPGLQVAAWAQSDPRYRQPDLARASEGLEALLELDPAQPNREFAAVLRPYQQRGLRWLHVLHELELGGVLADDMGLGKTVQLLAFLDDLRSRGELQHPALVVCPRSVVGHWQAEAERHAPRLSVALHLGSERTADRRVLARSDVVITSYQTLLRDIGLARTVEWTTVLLDEAQAVKNPESKIRRSLATLHSQSIFCVTGTPIENHLGELWSLIDLGVSGLLGRRSDFRVVFRNPIEKYGMHEPLELLRRRIRSFMLRRTKAEVDVELPPKTELVEYIDLHGGQRDLYESLRVALDAEVRQALKEKGASNVSFLVLEALLRLRQCCCDPRLIGTPEAMKVEESAKLERLIEMLIELRDAGRSVLVFSQFAKMLGLIEHACAAAGIDTLLLTGQTRDRQSVIDAFQAGRAGVFLISLKAGGAGLHLTAADTVIHYDPWWNPAAEDQATDRAHRIGQDRPVIVYRMCARGTLEEQIAVLQDEKRKLTDVSLRHAGAGHLSADDLQALWARI